MFFLCSMLRLFFVSIYVLLILFVLVVPVNSPFCLIGWTYLLPLKTIYSVHFVPHVLTVPYVLMVPHILLCSILWLFILPSNVLAIQFDPHILNVPSVLVVPHVLSMPYLLIVLCISIVLVLPFVLIVPDDLSFLFLLCFTYLLSLKKKIVLFILLPVFSMYNMFS